jgi:hypothetical protein
MKNRILHKLHFPKNPKNTHNIIFLRLPSFTIPDLYNIVNTPRNNQIILIRACHSGHKLLMGLINGIPTPTQEQIPYF